MFSNGVVTVVKGINVFLDVIDSCGYTKVFEFLLYLDIKACLVVLFGHLCGWNFLLSKGLSCLGVMAFYKVFIGFLLGYCKIYKRNSKCK